MNQKRFKIGDWVEVGATVKLGYSNVDEPGKRKARRTEIEPRLGQIGGIAVRYEGEYRVGSSGYSSFSDEYEKEQAYLDPAIRVELWEIKFGMMNKPVLALDEDVEGLSEFSMRLVRQKLPVFFSRQPKWTPKLRAMMREEMKDVPRDDKGRWMKA